MRVLGIDEAGRGCVLGALYVAGFVIDDVSDAVLLEAGAGDSKRLSPKRRWAARARLDSLGTPDVRAISSRSIDAGNLNVLEEEVIIDLIVTHRPDHVIIDALGHPSTLPATRQRMLDALAPHDLCPSILIEPKADHTYPLVGAASIYAKTQRDADLADLAKDYGVLGSGYPSDPKTRIWLMDWHDAQKPWPDFVRTRWGTVRDLVARAPTSA